MPAVGAIGAAILRARWPRARRLTEAPLQQAPRAIFKASTVGLYKQSQSILSALLLLAGAYLFINKRANRLKVLVHDGIGIWLCARRLHQGRFVWPMPGGAHTLTISQAQLDALVLGLPWQRLGEDGIITVV